MQSFKDKRNIGYHYHNGKAKATICSRQFTPIKAIISAILTRNVHRFKKHICVLELDNLSYYIDHATINCFNFFCFVNNCR